jgi:hypothetical protein
VSAVTSPDAAWELPLALHITSSGKDQNARYKVISSECISSLHYSKDEKNQKSNHY